MLRVEHVLKCGQGVRVKELICTVGHTITKGRCIIINIELRVDRWGIDGRKKRASLMNELPMKLESPRTETIIDSGIKMSPNRSHCKGTVVGANELAERVGNRVLVSEELHIVKGGFLKGWERYLSLIAAHPKLGSSGRGGRQAFIVPMKGMTGWA